MIRNGDPWREKPKGKKKILSIYINFCDVLLADLNLAEHVVLQDLRYLYA